MYNQHDDENGETHKQQDKPLVVAIAKAVVDKNTVVIKFLHTPIAEVAMVCIFGSQVFAVDAYIIQVVLFLNQVLQ